MKKIKKLMNKGLYDPNEENAFELFITSTDIKYVYYHETQRVLGNTFGMLVLQDFEAITPNLLCRTIETVQGGGVVVFLFNNMTSLKQLYTISMDVHDRYRTDSYGNVEPRFNERFILSLSTCKNCIVMDDEMNILPISSHIKQIESVKKDVDISQENVFLSERDKELGSLKTQMKDKAPIGQLIEMCKTLDQAKCVMAMVDSISEKSMRATVSINAGRGRGKSSAMGLAIASAVVFGYSNIFVTAPSPENLKTFFEFVIKGLGALNYREHKDFEIQEGVEEPFRHHVIKINIFRDHKQSISYILPTDVNIFQMSELLVIDEAAAIPLHIVKRIMRNIIFKYLASCLIFMASTIHGYEGTGRSLSIKLLNGLRQQSIANSNSLSGSSSRILREVQLNQAIRYADNDPVEDWLNRFLILDATDDQGIIEGYPQPEDLELYLVDRDTLFSFHKGSENFLKKLVNLFVSSHYKNSPNDLQLLSDAPAHSIFVLCRNIEKNKESSKSMPDIYAAIQVCEEGGISKNVILNHNKRGFKPAGDLIPWTVSEHYQDNEFPNLKGVRVVRIATHPDCQRMGYGSRALSLLTEFYEGKIINLNENSEELKSEKNKIEIAKESILKTEEIKPRKKLKPLLTKLSDTKPPLIYYLGTAFGLTKELFNFWRRGDFHPVYLKLTENDITGEHSCIMLKPFNVKEDFLKFDLNQFSNEYGNKIKWLNPYLCDFKKRLTTLLAFDLKDLSIKLSLSLLDPQISATTNEAKDEDTNFEENILEESIKKKELDTFISKYDFKRLELYTKNLVKYQMIIDLIPFIAKFYFLKKFPSVRLAYTQAAILLGFGLQYKSFEKINEELGLQTNQLLAMFNKMIKKFTSAIRQIYEKEIEIEENNNSKPNNQLEVFSILY